MKYEAVVTLCVAGEPDECLHFCFPSEGFLMDAWDAFDDLMAGLKAYRRKHPHDKAKGGKVKVRLEACVGRVGSGTHLDLGVNLWDFPVAALPELTRMHAAAKAHPKAAKYLVA